MQLFVTMVEKKEGVRELSGGLSTSECGDGDLLFFDTACPGSIRV